MKDGHKLMLSQSFAKNLGLYGERIGTFSVVCADEEEADRVASQLKRLVRPMYSSPPVHGARLAAAVLGDPSIRSNWEADVKSMADRIIAMRTTLRDALESHGGLRTWNHITDQIGMFAFTGLTEEQVLAMRENHAVFCTTDGRTVAPGYVWFRLEHWEFFFLEKNTR